MIHWVIWDFQNISQNAKRNQKRGDNLCSKQVDSSMQVKHKYQYGFTWTTFN